MDAITREGFDLVMTPAGREVQCAIYRAGGQIPLRRELIPSREKAEAWFERFIGEELAAPATQV